MNSQRLRTLIGRYHQSLVIIALSILLSASFISYKLVSALPIEPRGTMDRPILAIEIPRNEGEMSGLVSRQSVSDWRTIIRWDFFFIAGYVLLFVALWLPDSPATLDGTQRRGNLWQSVVFCIIATGIADCFENASILLCLGNIDRDTKLAGSRAFTTLPIFGTLKWLLFFLACRALALQYRERSSRWYWIGVGLRPLTTAGAWATLLAFAGLPGRPVIAFVAGLATVLILAASVTRLFPETIAQEVSAVPA
ncbi:MAG TPA: hypothetical protein VNN08_13055 [Thermoanaerobaculia bacterium]|nr:hypothetical protein [Thermoanaerobaculia bacterium]